MTAVLKEMCNFQATCLVECPWAISRRTSISRCVRCFSCSYKGGDSLVWGPSAERFAFRCCAPRAVRVAPGNSTESTKGLFCASNLRRTAPKRDRSSARSAWSPRARRDGVPCIVASRSWWVGFILRRRWGFSPPLQPGARVGATAISRSADANVDSTARDRASEHSFTTLRPVCTSTPFAKPSQVSWHFPLSNLCCQRWLG